MRGSSARGGVRPKEWRFHKNEKLRRNRRDPTLEKRARTGQLLVPLDTVHNEWKEHDGRRQLQAIGLHSRIYQDVFGSVFLPRGFMGIQYGEGSESVSVEQGNVVPTEKMSAEPTVSLPAELSEGFASLMLTDPDGHLTHGTMELLHWMVVNIPCGRAVSDGTQVTPYLQPVPPRGSGFHRYVFSLYTHPRPLSETTPTGLTGKSNWLEQRTFSTRKFLSVNSNASPYTFSFCQSQWDQGVHNVFMKTLVHPEPVYQLKHHLTPRRERQKLIKLQRSTRYSVM